MIRLSKSCISAVEQEAVRRVLDAEYLGIGKNVFEFEEELSDLLGRQVCCVSSGTAALHLSLQAIGVSAGDDVLVPSLTYVASFQAISATGANPVACDVDIETLQISLQDAENRLTDRTRAIMPVYYGGLVLNQREILDFAGKHSIDVVEDAAHAFGSHGNLGLVGSSGGITCFSFDGIKNITCGEGGCIVTNDSDLLEKVKTLRLLGVDKDTDARRQGGRSWRPVVREQGWRYHMNNIAAAIGSAQLKRFDVLAQARQQAASYYQHALSSHSFVHVLPADYSYTVPHIFPIWIDVHDTACRDVLGEKLREDGIETGVHYYPNHLLEKYSTIEKVNLPNTEYLASRIMTLPLHPELTVEELEYVVNRLCTRLEALR